LSLNPYVILRKIDPPEKCYLSEVLLWRAFGRFPEILFDLDAKDWRFSSEALENYGAPIPDGPELTAEECRFADLPNDPRMIALTEEGGYSDLDFYDKMLSLPVNDEGISKANVKELKSKRASAVKYYSELEKWIEKYRDYVDQFQAEICLKLRRGELHANGNKLPNPDPALTDKILEKSNKWLTELDIVEISKEHWITETINWEDSAIYGRSESFVWIHVRTEDMLKAFPPTDLLKADDILPIGSHYAVTSSAFPNVQKKYGQRGRPALPWQDFHIEVARMFRDGQMPIKKEAAIAHIQNWFIQTFGKDVSRAAVGERLKPYFDKLIKKGQ
jgi:hypothetical protein